MTLRILTLNLWNDAGPYATRAEMIGRAIDRLEPDVIGFQEALLGPGLDQAASLLEGRGYGIEFGAASDWNLPETSFGNVVASRWPIIERDELKLPDNGDHETRAALGVTIDSPFGPISVTSTHLNWRFNHGVVREEQVVALCSWVMSRRPRGGYPPILLGDFNAEPDSAEIRYISGLQSLAGKSVYFNDAWKVAGGDGPGITWSNTNDYARDWLEPNRRIDYVFTGEPRRNGLGLLTHCRLVCDEAVAGVWPSDHFGVYAEMRSEPIPALADRVG